MIHLFHGDNSDASRKELALLREKHAGKEIVVLEGKKVTVTELKQATESTSLFGTERVVIVENLLKHRLTPKSKDDNEVVAFIKNLPKEVEIVFWEDKEIGKTILSHFPKNIDLAVFRHPREIFTFVESIRPGNTVAMLELFNQSTLHDEVELLFAMLVRQFHYIIMVKDMGKNVAELTPWQTAKFAKQAENFTLKDLIIHYGQLLDIDVKIKTGATPFNLTQEVKLFLISI